MEFAAKCLTLEGRDVTLLVNRSVSNGCIVRAFGPDRNR